MPHELSVKKKEAMCESASCKILSHRKEMLLHRYNVAKRFTITQTAAIIVRRSSGFKSFISCFVFNCNVRAVGSSQFQFHKDISCPIMSIKSSWTLPRPGDLFCHLPISHHSKQNAGLQHCIWRDDYCSTLYPSSATLSWVVAANCWNNSTFFIIFIYISTFFFHLFSHHLAIYR